MFEKNLIKIDASSIKKEPQHMAYITIPGSGSETSNTSVINFQNFKYFIISKSFIPDHVVYISSTFKNLDTRKIYQSILDPLTHGIESLFSPLKTPISESFSLNTIEIIYNFILQDDFSISSY